MHPFKQRFLPLVFRQQVLTKYPYAERVLSVSIVPRMLVECDKRFRTSRIPREQFEALRDELAEQGHDPEAECFFVVADRFYCENHTLPEFVWDMPVYVRQKAGEE